MLERDVDAFLARELAHDRLEPVLAVVDHVIGAERPGLDDLLVVADRGDDGRADLLRHFDGAGADAGAAGLHQDGLARLELRVVEQHVLHGAECDRRAGGVAMADGSRHRHHEPRRHVDEVAREAVDVEAHHAADVLAQIVASLAAGLAGAAGQPAIADHAIARLHGGDAVADRRDLARRLDAHDQRQLAFGESHAAPAPHVEVIEPDRLDADLHLAGARRGRLGHVEDVDLAVGDEGQRAHC
jgi:hypothetical protein